VPGVAGALDGQAGEMIAFAGPADSILGIE
jgi:hypothetical protein